MRDKMSLKFRPFKRTTNVSRHWMTGRGQAVFYIHTSKATFAPLDHGGVTSAFFAFFFFFVGQKLVLVLGYLNLVKIERFYARRKRSLQR